MRSPTITAFCGTVVLILAGGCSTESGVYYRQKAPETVQIIAHDRHTLGITISSPVTNATSFAVVDSDCVLSDQKGRRYGLKFQLSGSHQDVDRLRSWYDVTAYGPLPSAAHHDFADGPYDITIAFTEQGHREVVQVPFEFHTSSIPYPILWTGWWIHRPTSP